MKNVKRFCNFYVLLYDEEKGWCGNGMYRKYFGLNLFLFIISISLLSGCLDQGSSDQSKVDNKVESEEKESLGVEESTEKVIVPLSVSEGDFGSIIGWLNDETIVYLTNSGQSSNVFTYNVYTGKSTPIYESDSPIVMVYISPSKERLLIHASPSSYEGTVTILDENGAVLTTQSIVSSEMSFVWNPYNEDLVLISAFTEDWDFQVSLLNIKEAELTEVSIPQPFANWLTEEELLYLGWDENTVSLFAPLMKQGIFNKVGEQQNNFTNLFQLYSYRDMILTISVNDDEKQAVYSFLTNQLEPIQTMSIPHLSEFSEWLVPYHDVNLEKKLFFTLRPLFSGEADTYKDGFELVSYQLDDGKENVILKDLENKPLSCSPNSEYCLYGFQFESIIDLGAKTIVDLIKG